MTRIRLATQAPRERSSAPLPARTWVAASVTPAPRFRAPKVNRRLGPRAFFPVTFAIDSAPQGATFIGAVSWSFHAARLGVGALGLPL